MTTQKIIDAMNELESPYLSATDGKLLVAIRSLAINFQQHTHFRGEVVQPSPGQTSDWETFGKTFDNSGKTEQPKLPSELAVNKADAAIRSSDLWFSRAYEMNKAIKLFAIGLDAARNDALEEAARIADGIVYGAEKTPEAQKAHDIGWDSAARYIARTIRIRKESR
jgi:hypothetical protein